MSNSMRSYTKIKYLFLFTLLALVSNLNVYASDHADTSLHISEGRNDARITDMYAFVNGSNLVLILCTDPTVPVGAEVYNFPTDVEYTFYIDNDIKVDNMGNIADKDDIDEDIIIKIRFDGDGTPIVDGERKFSLVYLPFLLLYSCSSSDNLTIEESITAFFAGPRDDPFIRAPRTGLNVASIVLELPLDVVIDHSNTIAIWATTNVDGFPGEFQERFGRPFISQLNEELNSIHPSEDFVRFGIEPDVMILNTSLPSGFPNGRLPEDDVLDIVCPGLCDNIINSDDPFPSMNDLPFLDDFPYLSPPQ